MEDAKITPTAPKRESPQGIPSLVTDDDLKLEIGQWVVASLNKDKMIRQLAIQQQKLMQQVTEGVEAVKKAAELEKSTKALSEQNLALDQELTKARTRATDAVRKVATAEGTLVSTRTALEKAVAVAETARGKAQAEKVRGKEEAQADAVKATEALAMLQGELDLARVMLRGELDLAQEEIKKLKARKRAKKRAKKRA